MCKSGQSEHLKNLQQKRSGGEGGWLSDLLKIFGDNKGKEPVGGQVAAENGVSTPLGK